MEDNERREIKCEKCGRTRMLSIDEAMEDGWKIDTKFGLMCYHCQPRYGIPCTFLRSTRYAGLFESENGDIGIEIKFGKAGD